MEQRIRKDFSFLFGLIGYPLSHSFSKRYFNDKFRKEALNDYYYELFPLKNVDELHSLILNQPRLMGLNVTIPYKKVVIPFLDEIEVEAQTIGAVNTIRIREGKLKGFNTDVYGFEQSLVKKMDSSIHQRALILGTGGAAQAVAFVLNKCQIPFKFVSRRKDENDCLGYSDLNEVMDDYQIIINTTPLGMSPAIDSKPNLPYDKINGHHLLYDLVYNPAETAFLKEGNKRGAATINGLEMLHLQAEKAWEIWNA